MREAGFESLPVEGAVLVKQERGGPHSSTSRLLSSKEVSIYLPWALRPLQFQFLATLVQEMGDPDVEIHAEFLPFFCLYKSGRVEQPLNTTIVPPSPTQGISCKDVAVSPDVSARLYLPKLSADNDDQSNTKIPILIYYHGSAFCMESAFSFLYHPYVTSLCARTGALVVSVEYRLSPEHPLPAAHDDAWAALQWALSPSPDDWLAKYGDTQRVFLAGDSAGANLAHYVASRASYQSLSVTGMVLVHPYFGDSDCDSEYLKKAWEAMSVMDIDDPRHKPAADEKGMAELKCKRVMVAVAAEDDLKGRGIAYLEALKKSGWGGEVEMVEADGEDHCFHLYKPGCAKSEELMERIVGFINGN